MNLSVSCSEDVRSSGNSASCVFRKRALRKRERSLKLPFKVVNFAPNPNEIHAFRMDFLSVLSKARIHDVGPWKLHRIDLSGNSNPLNDPQE